MRILIIDGQGGRIGKQLVESILKNYPQAELTAIGTNAIATSAMIKSGAKRAATGENAVITACRRADVIIGPVCIVIADALLGEITPNMALAVGQSDAKRILIPVNRCENLIAGVGDTGINELIADAVNKLKNACC